MDVKLLADEVIQHAQPLAVFVSLLIAATLLLRSALAKRLKAVFEETLFSNWQLSLLALTGLVLSLASGWTTWDGMRNFTGDPLLSGMITFGIQGVMLIVAWLIGESFATGMNTRSLPTQPRFANPATQTWVGTIIGLLLFIGLLALVLQWSGQTDLRQATTDDLAWSRTGDKFIMFGVAILLVALFALYAASDVVRPYLQGSRVILRNVVLWVMFLACMATSVFFSFDSLFSTIFPQDERVRAAALRAQNQVAGVIADIEQTISNRQAAETDALFRTEAWLDYDAQLSGIARVATESEGAIERYVNEQIETRRRAVNEQQERMSSAQAGQAGLAGRKISLTDEKSQLTTRRPELVADYTAKKTEHDARLRDIDAKRVEALAEQKGVEGTGREGRGPVYRQRMTELRLLQNTAKIAEERMEDARKRLTDVEQRLAGIDRELATIDGDLAKLKGEAETAEQRIKLASESATDDSAPKLDPTRVLPAFERAKSEFRAGPTLPKLTALQTMCGDITNALAATPETKSRLKGLDCDPKATADAAGPLFALQNGIGVFLNSCSGGDKLVANQSADQLFAFARRCLADSSLPSQDTDTLRNKINSIELARDDKAHRFVVTWNAFNDGNRLAYLALSIALAIDTLVFMSGLFGANAVRSPLSDVPTSKARSASQLEATINAALGPHPNDTAWLTLNALRPMTNQDGFSAFADLSQLERSAADRVRMVLTAGADIGAVEAISINPERYRVRSELREYLSSVCDKHFKTDVGAKDNAKLTQLVTSALAPHVKEHADIVLHSLEPMREQDGFTSRVLLFEIHDAYDTRIIRRVMNAGSAIRAVVPDKEIADCYYVRPSLYEALLTLHATTSDSPSYVYDRQRFTGVQVRPAIDGGSLNEAAEKIEHQPVREELPPPPRALPLTPPPLSDEEKLELINHYRDELLGAVQLTPGIVDRILRTPQNRDGIQQAWRALTTAGKQRPELGQFLRDFQNIQANDISETYSRLVSENDGDDRKRPILERVEMQIQSDLALYNLLPEVGLIDYLIEEIERAAQPDDGLTDGEQLLKDQLRHVRDGLAELNLESPRSWDEIRERLSPKLRPRNSNGQQRSSKPSEDGDDYSDKDE